MNGNNCEAFSFVLTEVIEQLLVPGDSRVASRATRPGYEVVPSDAAEVD